MTCEHEHRAWLQAILAAILFMNAETSIVLGFALFFGGSAAINMGRSIWLDWKESS